MLHTSYQPFGRLLKTCTWWMYLYLISKSAFVSECIKFYNLDMNKSEPFAKYKTHNKVLSTVNSGMRYKLAYETCVTCPESDLLVTIIFACDKSKVSNLGKAPSPASHCCSSPQFKTSTCKAFPQCGTHLGTSMISALLLCSLPSEEGQLD